MSPRRHNWRLAWLSRRIGTPFSLGYKIPMAFLPQEILLKTGALQDANSCPG